MESFISLTSAVILALKSPSQALGLIAKKKFTRCRKKSLTKENYTQNENKRTKKC